MFDSENEQDDGNENDLPDSNPFRWVRYISLDRRMLWCEYPSDETVLPYRNDVPDAREWRNAIDAVFATRLPQHSVKTLVFDGRPRQFSLKAFPDFGVGRHFRGVVQVVEMFPSRRPRNTATAILHSTAREVFSPLDLSISGVVLYDPAKDKILHANRRLSQETGYAEKDLAGMSGRVLFGDDGVALLKNTHQRMLTAGDGVVWGQALAVRDRKGNSERYFCSLILSSPEAGGVDKQVLLISLDGMEMDAATGVIRDGPNPRFVLEALQEGLWEYDAVRRVFHYNRRYAELFGDDGLPGGKGKKLEDWFNSIYPGEPDKVIANWRQLLKNGIPYRVFYRVRDTKKGEWHWIISTIHAILNDAKGRPVRIIGFHMDISDALQTEKNLSDGEERLRVVFESSGIGIALARDDGSLYRVNPALAHMLGRNVSDFERKQLFTFAHPDSQGDLLQALDRLMHGGRKEHMQDLLFLRPDGREVWINVTANLSRKVSSGKRYIILTAEDVTTSHASREKLQYEATHDVMTGAWTRWVLFERLEQHIHLAQRHSQPMTFAICDLDHFKAVNDMYGHQAGDRVLVRFVEILKGTLRDTDLIGRYGGEEFGVVFPSTDVRGAADSLERALGRMRRERFTDDNNNEFTVTATIGVSGVTPCCNSKQVVAWADNALYKGKENGRDQIVLADPPEGKWL